MSGKEGTDQAEDERNATEVLAQLRKEQAFLQDHKQATELFDRVEGELCSGFTEVMLKPRASALAARVRHVSVTVIYQED